MVEQLAEAVLYLWGSAVVVSVVMLLTVPGLNKKMSLRRRFLYVSDALII